MQTLDLLQGSPEWVAVRAKHFTASEAPAMLGLSKYVTRAELLRQKATGFVEEVGASKQRLFDAGHAAEAAARPIAERLIGEDLFPVTGSAEIDGLPLLASFDGLTMCEDVCWENKLWNDDFAQQARDSIVPDTHWPQLEQQLLLSGAGKVLFTISDGTEEKTVSTWYASQPARRAQLIAGWKQFAEDLANYRHVEVIPAAVAAPTIDLPAVSVQVSGQIALISNLDLFGKELNKFIASIDREPKDDQAFANAESAIKTLQKAQDALEAAESGALAQTASIDEMRRTVALYVEQARTTRLMLEKLVKSAKESRKLEILNGGKEKLAALIADLNKQLGKPYMPAIAADFAGKMRSLKTIASLQNAVDTEFARAKIEADQAFERIDANLKSLRELAADHSFLFADTHQLVAKANDDLIAVIKSRIAEHKEAEQKRIDAEREKIRTEEVARLEREQRESAELAAKVKREEEMYAQAQARIADQQAAEAKARDQAESAKPVPAVTPALTAPVGNVHPMIGDIMPNQSAGGEASRLQAEIREQVSVMCVEDLRLVLHYIGRVQAQRVAA